MKPVKRNLFFISILILAALLAVLLFLSACHADDDQTGDATDVFLESDLPYDEGANTCDVPILMYHNISPDEWGDATVTLSTFEAQIKALCDAGYTSVTLRDLVDFVELGKPLPDKPIVITFDDGYMSNYEYAFPILREYGMCATVFVIGYSFGCNTYKDTGISIIPHFGETEAYEMAHSGVIDIQSHTYDMHQSEAIEGELARTTVAQLQGETDADYEAALRADVRMSRALIVAATGEEVFALAYPRGYYNSTAQRVFAEEGISVTLTTDHGINTIVMGISESLYGLKRFNVDESMTPEILLSLIK